MKPTKFNILLVIYILSLAFGIKMLANAEWEELFKI